MLKKLLSLTLPLLAAPAFAAESAHWAYEGAGAPENWGKLAPEYALCGTGKSQSPIDIRQTIEAELPALGLHYGAKASEVINNGHTIQVNVPEGSTLEIDGSEFMLKQFHFHAPSENLISGRSFPLEVHFVHADKAGNLAVIGVMFETGAGSAPLADIFGHAPASAGGKGTLAAPLDPAKLLPVNKDYYRFAGSLTTPPCSEGVRWLVMKQPITAGKAEVDAFNKLMHHHTNRPVQPVHARPVLR
jgi:carbonic anhydrase